MEDLALIQRLISKFANSFDLKAWNDLTSCLSDNLYTDYSELRGTPAVTMTKENFVEMRQLVLQELKTHHLAGNVEIYLDGVCLASAKVSMVIFRKNSAGEVLNTHCLYLLKFTKNNNEWRISSIIQKVFWSDGNKSIHQGIVK